MPATLTDCGETTTATPTAAPAPRPAAGRVTADNVEPVGDLGDLLGAFAAEHDHLNQTGVAGLLGWPEQTFRRYRDGTQSPTYERLAAALHRRGCESLLLAVLVRLAGRKFAVARADPGPAAPVADQASRPRELAVEAMAALVEVVREVNASLEDGRVSESELLRIHGRTAAGRRRLDQVDAAAAALHCRTAAGR